MMDKSYYIYIFVRIRPLLPRQILYNSLNYYKGPEVNLINKKKTIPLKKHDQQGRQCNAFLRDI